MDQNIENLNHSLMQHVHKIETEIIIFKNQTDCH